jgi:hypothetical protein
VVASEALLALHERIFTLSQPLVSNLFAHSTPGHWTLAIAGLASDIEASIVGLRRWDSDARTEHVLIS